MKCGEKLGKWIFLKRISKTNPRNQKSQILDQDSWRNHKVNEIEISEIEKAWKTEIEIEII